MSIYASCLILFTCGVHSCSKVILNNNQMKNINLNSQCLCPRVIILRELIILIYYLNRDAAFMVQSLIQYLNKKTTLKNKQIYFYIIYYFGILNVWINNLLNQLSTVKYYRRIIINISIIINNIWYFVIRNIPWNKLFYINKIDVIEKNFKI